MTTDSSANLAYILGMAMSHLFSVQNHLVQGQDKEALSKINEAVRELKPLVEKHIYNIEKPEVPNESA